MSALASPRLIVINPLSGRRGEQLLSLVQQNLAKRGLGFEVFHTTPDPLTNAQLLQAKADEFSEWICIGGDGSLNLVANVIAGRNISLGIVPCGSGNDFARCLPFRSEDIIDIACGEQVRLVDLGRCNDRYFVNVLGIGFDAHVVTLLSDSKPRRLRRWRYLLMAAIALVHYRERPAEIQASRQMSGSLFMAAFANGRFFGGGMHIAPHADCSDGLLDCCWVSKARWWQKCIHLLRIFSGAHLRSPAVHYWQDTHFRVPTPNLPIEGDGEFFGYTPAEIRICPQALRLKWPT